MSKYLFGFAATIAFLVVGAVFGLLLALFVTLPFCLITQIVVTPVELNYIMLTGSIVGMLIGLIYAVNSKTVKCDAIELPVINDPSPGNYMSSEQGHSA